jgi:hypothetical protein
MLMPDNNMVYYKATCQTKKGPCTIQYFEDVECKDRKIDAMFPPSTRVPSMINVAANVCSKDAFIIGDSFRFDIFELRPGSVTPLDMWWDHQLIKNEVSIYPTLQDCQADRNQLYRQINFELTSYGSFGQCELGQGGTFIKKSKSNVYNLSIEKEKRYLDAISTASLLKGGKQKSDYFVISGHQSSKSNLQSLTCSADAFTWKVAIAVSSIDKTDATQLTCIPLKFGSPSFRSGTFAYDPQSKTIALTIFPFGNCLAAIREPAFKIPADKNGCTRDLGNPRQVLFSVERLTV